MLRSQHHVSGAEKGIGAGGKNFHLGLIIGDPESNRRTLAAADPVLLKQLYALRPIKRVELIDQPLGVFRDPQHPLPQRTPLDGVAFSFPFLDFLIREDGAKVRRPPHRRVGDVGEAHPIDLITGPAFRLQFGNGFGLIFLLAEVR